MVFFYIQIAHPLIISLGVPSLSYVQVPAYKTDASMNEDLDLIKQIKDMVAAVGPYFCKVDAGYNSIGKVDRKFF